MSDVAADPKRPEAATLGEIVRDVPAAAAVFEKIGLEFCCGGDRTLAAACEEKGLDAATVTVMLDALPDPGSDPSGHDLTRSSIGEICDHIVADHHQRFREESAKLAEIVETVVRVHGPEHPELAGLERDFTALRADMLTHAEREETELFPAAVEAAAAGTALDPAVLAELEADHRATGELLESIRATCGGYDLDAAFCGTHRLMLMNLRDLEADTHQHVHEENNILFPLIRDLHPAA